MTRMTSIYDFEARQIDGKTVPLKQFRGKVLLIVNTASACGFTPQFGGLEELHQTYGKKGLVVLGFPCNQFGAQDPGSNEEIAQLLPAQLRRELSDDGQDRRERPDGRSAVPVAHRGSARACWAARRSSGTSPSSWSARTAR